MTPRSASAQARGFTPPAFETIRTLCLAISFRLGFITALTKSSA